MNTQTTRSALLLLAAGGTALLAGCGGGGSNGNTGTGTTTTGTTGTTGTTTGTPATAQIVGKVTDVTGKGIPGVSVAVDTGGQITTTISTGGYRLNNLTAGVHVITVSVTQAGIQYTGSTQVSATENSLTSNANILVSPVTQQATVKGTVKDSSGNVVIGASVYLAVPNVAVAGSSGNYSSLVAFTDSSGFYQISNIPASLPTGSLVMTAAAVTSAAAYGNQNVTLPQTTITAGSVTTQNFTLAVSANQAASAKPVLTGINAFTQPIDGLTSSALKSRIASGSVYESLRRLLSPSYASFASRKRSVGKKLSTRAVTGSYAVETDIAFTPPAATSTNLLGYNIYQTTGPIATNAVTEANADFYDTVFDPLANYYTDLTATTDKGASYASGTTYNFALSSLASGTVSSSSTTIESSLSTVLSITPLGPLTLNTPVASATVTTPVTLTWTPVTGATHYYVFIYSQYPTAATSPTATSGALPAGTATASITLTGGSVTYYAVVVATEDEAETAGSTTTTVNAAQSYSEITKFVVQ